MDVFLENFQTALTPSLFGNYIAFFLQNFFPEKSVHKFAMNFFGLAMTPPSPPPFWTFLPKFTTKIYRFETKKNCNVIFWIGTFPKKHPYLGRRSPLSELLLKTFGQQWLLHWQYSHQDDHQEDDPDDQHDDHEEGLDRRGDGCAGGGVIMWRMGSATDTFTLHFAILFIEQHFVLLSATDTSFTQHTADATLCTSLQSISNTSATGAWS